MATATTDIYPYGQCTYYVAEVYPQINAAGNLGNACNWLNGAKQRGWYTSGTPWNGAVVVFQCAINPQNEGHVAVVTSVNTDGSLTITDMNWQTVGQVLTHTVSGGTRQLVLGFFQAPGGPGPKNPANGAPAANASQAAQGDLATTDQLTGYQSNQDPPCPEPSPPTGARGGPCQVAIRTRGIRFRPFGQINPNLPVIGDLYNISWCLGGVSICMDGLLGVLLMGSGVAVIVLGVVLAVKNPVERIYGGYVQGVGTALEVGGGVAGQPEVAAGGRVVANAGRGIRRRGAANTMRAEGSRALRRRAAQYRADQQRQRREAAAEAGREWQARQAAQQRLREQLRERTAREREAVSEQRGRAAAEFSRQQRERTQPTTAGTEPITGGTA